MKKLIPLLTLAFVATTAFAGPVTVEYRASQRVLSITRTVLWENLDANLAGMYASLQNHLAAYGHTAAGPAFTRTFGETTTTVTIQAGYPIASNFPGGSIGEIVSGYLPGGRMLTSLHVGADATIDFAYTDIENFMWTYGYISLGAPWEFYLEPTATGVPRTLIVWPVSKIAGE